jgi:hypothetical protein
MNLGSALSSGSQAGGKAKRERNAVGSSSATATAGKWLSTRSTGTERGSSMGNLGVDMAWIE